MFYFSKWDEKKQKTFISRCPKPASKVHDHHCLRDWYYKFHNHAKQYGIYVHNYFDFRKLSGDPKGFTCGTDSNSTPYDVPLLLQPRLREWDSTIHAALQDVFSTSGTQEYRIVQNKHGKGYEALFDIIRPNHPEHDTYPSLLISDKPSQRDRQSISDYFNEYINYLKLSSYLDNVARSLNQPRELETFIGNLRQGREFLDKTYDERQSNDPLKKGKYEQGNLVGTLESVARRIRPARPTSTHSPIPKKELSYSNKSQQLQRKLPPQGQKGSLPTKKVQSLGVFREEDPYTVFVSDDVSSPFEEYVKCYTNAIRSDNLQEGAFDTTRPCAVCKKPGHTFDDCPVLNNVGFLKQHFIQYKLFQNKQEANMPHTADVNRVTFADCDHSNDADSSADEELPYAEDFHQGRE